MIEAVPGGHAGCIQTRHIAAKRSFYFLELVLGIHRGDRFMGELERAFQIGQHLFLGLQAIGTVVAGADIDGGLLAQVGGRHLIQNGRDMFYLLRERTHALEVSLRGREVVFVGGEFGGEPRHIVFDHPELVVKVVRDGIAENGHRKKNHGREQKCFDHRFLHKDHCIVVNMYWSRLAIQTLREDVHPGLVRAGYKRGSEYLELGRRSLAKIERLMPDIERMGIGYVRAGGHFVAETPAGEHVLVLGKDYAALLDDAVSIATPPEHPDPEGDFTPEEFSTPGVKTIAQIAEFSGLPPASQMKSLVMRAGALVMVLLRGDHQLNPHKFAVFTGASAIRQASSDELREALGADAGSLGPVGAHGLRIVADEALRGRRNMISGANRNDFHLRNVTPEKDFACEFADLRTVCQQDTCLNGGALRLSNASLLDSPASILETAAEQHHDADGLTLPRAIAPFDVILTPVHPSHLDAAQKLYEELSAAGLEVLLDDREARPGVKFKDADLIGIPVRINLGKKLAEGLVEIVERHPKRTSEASLVEVANFLRSRIT